MKYEHYHVIGLQRMGTNWLHALIKKNFKVTRNQTFWKHLTPLGQNEDEDYENIYGPEGSNLTLDNNTFYIATCKDYDTWVTSLKKRKVDFWRSHNFPNPEDKKYHEIYNPWVAWKDSNTNKENFYYKDYTDWNKNWKTHLAEIQTITGWKTYFDDFVSVDNRY